MFDELRPGESFRTYTAPEEAALVADDAAWYMKKFDCTFDDAVDDMDWPVPSNVREAARNLIKAA